MLDFYDAILAAIGAPRWHGKNPNALVETLVWTDQINELKPPFLIRILGTAAIPREVLDHISLVEDDIRHARADRRELRGIDVEVSLETDMVK